MAMTHLDSVLVANRGEIAVRVISTLRRMGIRSIAVFSDADAQAPHVMLADIAVRLGPTPAHESYLNIDRVIETVRSTGASAVHPGYGFLSENVDFARALDEAGIIFIGPPVHALTEMGDKIRAKRTAIEAGVPVVPGRHDPGMDDQALESAAEEIGFPVLLKPSAGGGGKGMRIVTEPGGMREAITSARREARGSFGDDTLLIERFVTRPRHIEVQVFGDTHGGVVHLGERECSLQRRHQKVIEEAPSPLLDATTREALCDSAVRLARAVGYVGAGTVEYVVPSDAPGDFAFLEMNTRLQVEHPVTEAVTGVDLVEWQIRVAAGEPLPLMQEEIAVTGHAIEARVYAEDPQREFIPTGGRVLEWVPADHARTDAGIESGSEIGSAYDPMLAKVIVAGDDRPTALDRASQALSETVLLGVRSNIDYLRFLVEQPQVRSGDLDTGLIARVGVPEPIAWSPQVFAAALLARLPEGLGTGFAAADGWRIGAHAPLRLDVRDAHAEASNTAVWEVAFQAPDRLHISGGVTGESRLHTVEWRPSGARMLIDVDGAAREMHVISAQDRVWVHSIEDGTVCLRVSTPLERRLRVGAAGGLGGHWAARSPMPGAVVMVPVSVGDRVSAGDPVAVVEAMKMEHTVRAPADGVVTAITVSVGSQVRLEEELVQLDLAVEDQVAAR